MSGWMHDTHDPETWSSDRVKRLRAVYMLHGDIDAARAVWMAHTQQEPPRSPVERDGLTEPERDDE